MYSNCDFLSTLDAKEASEYTLIFNDSLSSFGSFSFISEFAFMWLIILSIFLINYRFSSLKCFSVI